MKFFCFLFIFLFILSVEAGEKELLYRFGLKLEVFQEGKAPENSNQISIKKNNKVRDKIKGFEAEHKRQKTTLPENKEKAPDAHNRSALDKRQNATLPESKEKAPDAHNRSALDKRQKTTLPESKAKSEKKDCSAAGQDLIYSHNFSSNALNLSGNIEKWFNKSLLYVKKAPPGKCPKQCKQGNTYQALSKIYPKKVKKGSCKGREAEESYSFEKRFLSLKSAIETSHEEMREWLLGTFVYPFFSILGMDLSPEAIKSNIAAACPSCSFYLDFSYKYIEGKSLDLTAKARCGDIKRLISGFQFEFTLVNNWKCEKEP